MKLHDLTTLRFLAFITATSIAALVVSCAPIERAAPPVATLTLPKNANLKKLEEGRAIYASACVRCHGPARVYKRTDEQWSQIILPKMREMSKLNPNEIDALTTYVMTARKALAEKPAN